MKHFQRSSDFGFEEFLSEYWQQKPILIKNFFSIFVEPLTSEELAGLALEEFVESRLVIHTPPSNYHLEQGPVAASRFDELGDENWTLLVQAVDELIPEVAQLKHVFNFLPDWRIDDVMISFAAPGGGVGPHLDYYDVFLVQGAGSRTWKLGDMLPDDAQKVTESGLKLLEKFEVKQEVTLSSGDVLYIPPGIPHWGIANEEGLCYSVGFRAPSKAELIESFSDVLMDRSTSADRYQDGPQVLRQTPRPGEIALADIMRAWEMLKTTFADEPAFVESFASLATQPRYPERVVPVARELAADELGTGKLVRSPSSRFAWLESESPAELMLFVNGDRFQQPASNLQAVISLCDVTIDNILEISTISDEESWRSLLLELVCQGSLIADPD